MSLACCEIASTTTSISKHCCSFVRARARTWTRNEIAAALNIPESVAAKVLEDLMRGGLMRSSSCRPSRIRLQSNDARVPETTEQLAAHYETNRIAIMQLINANAIERVRRDAVRAFADAFVLGRKKDDG